MIRRFLLSLVVVLGLVNLTQAWHSPGHQLVARAAATTLPASMPAFLRSGGPALAKISLDPDLARNRLTPQWADAHAADHFFDVELLGDAPLPATRHQFIALCQQRGIAPEAVGYLPYAIVENTQRLALALAEYRKAPDDPVVQAKCLVYAGLLSHLAADLEQPLHTTVHYDGRVEVAGKSPRTGIHTKVDALPTPALPLERVTEGLSPRVLPNLWDAVQQELAASHAKVDRVYDLEAKLPERGATEVDAAVAAFTLERMRAATLFNASLLMTAWALSETITLPDWALPAATLPAE